MRGTFVYIIHDTQNYRSWLTNWILAPFILRIVQIQRSGRRLWNSWKFWSVSKSDFWARSREFTAMFNKTENCILSKILTFAFCILHVTKNGKVSFSNWLQFLSRASLWKVHHPTLAHGNNQSDAFTAIFSFLNGAPQCHDTEHIFKLIEKKIRSLSFKVIIFILSALQKWPLRSWYWFSKLRHQSFEKFVFCLSDTLG